jgi:hypothetical protein
MRFRLLMRFYHPATPAGPQVSNRLNRTRSRPVSLVDTAR